MDEQRQQESSNNKKIGALLIFAVVAVIGIISVFVYAQYKKTHITTDDAFIDGNIHVVAARIAGTVKRIHVSDNQLVRKGELILEIDPADYDIKMKEAESALITEKSRLSEAGTRVSAARMQLAELGHRVESAKANLELQNANLRQAEFDITRAENLLRKDAISKERHEKTRTGYDIALAQVKAAKDQLKQAESAIDIQKAVIKQMEAAINSQDALMRKSEAQLKSSELGLSYTKLSAPSGGHITKKSVQPGNQIQPGQPLMAVVPLDDIWIIGNFKETQLEKIRPGQRVEIKVDAYPGKKFRGKVESIMAGTGSVFSLFPPENATGNFVKVVQRIPIKIVLDKGTDSEHILRIGMSVEPTIFIE